MKIKSIYIGGWFQRTMLQLSEIYDFLRDGSSQAGLDKDKLLSLRENLNIETIEYGIASEEFVAFTAAGNIKVKIFEDGLTTVSSHDVSEKTMLEDVDHLRDYYENHLSAVFDYLFSMGAPVFKELSRVENLYPYFIVCDRASDTELSDLLAQTEHQKYFEFESKSYSILRGDKYYFINNKKSSLENIEHYIEEQVFIREFKGQLHRYLNLHRAIWGKIDAIKKQTYLRESEILAAETELAKYKKTTLLIKGRLEQMLPYVKIREANMKGDEELNEFLAISGFRHAALMGTLTYMTSVWDTTEKYIATAERLLDRAERARSVSLCRSLLAVVSFLAVISVLGLIFGTALNFTVNTVIYGALLIIAVIICGKVVKTLSDREHYQLLMDEEKEEA